MNTTRNDDFRPGAAFARLALLSVAAAAVAAAVGYYPTRALAGPGAVRAMGIGIAIALLAASAGLVPPLLAIRLGPKQHLNGMLAGMAIRFVLLLTLLLAALLSGLGEKAPLALWAAIGYIILLAVDTAGLAWLNKRLSRTTS
jgi:hypothetical protein